MKTRLMALMVCLILLTCAFGASAEKEPLTVTYLSCWSGSSANFPEDVTGNASAQLIRDKFGIELTMSDNGGNQTEAGYLNMMFAADNVPDAVNAPYWGAEPGGEGAILINGAIEGMVKDISPYLDQFPNIKALYETEGVLSASVMKNLIHNEKYPEGAIYFIPNDVDANADEYRSVYGDTLYARADVLEAVGVKAEEVRTIEDLVNLLETIRDSGLTDWNGAAIIPLGTGHDGWRNANIYNWLRGNNISNWRRLEDGTVTYYLFTDYVENRINLMRRLLSEGLMDVECLTQTDEVAQAKVLQGSYGVISVDANAVTNVFYYDNGIVNSHPEARWVPLGLTNLDGNNCVDVYQKGYSGGGVTFFRADIEENKLLALLSLMDWMCSDEGAAFNSYGVEGVTFEYDEQHRPVLLSDVQAKIDEDSKVRYNYGIKQFNAFNIYSKDNTRWPRSREEMTAKEAAYQDMCNFFRPRVEVSGMSVEELLSGWEGYDELNDNLATLDVGTMIQRAYYFETDEEVAKMIDDLRAKAIGFGIEDAMKYIQENLTDDYVF